jgi:hypothetical protein
LIAAISFQKLKSVVSLLESLPARANETQNDLVIFPQSLFGSFGLTWGGGGGGAVTA